MPDIEITEAWLAEFAARRRNVDEDPTWIAIRISERDALVAELERERTRTETLRADLRYTLAWMDAELRAEFKSDPDGARIVAASVEETP